MDKQWSRMLASDGKGRMELGKKLKKEMANQHEKMVVRRNREEFFMWEEKKEKREAEKLLDKE